MRFIVASLLVICLLVLNAQIVSAQFLEAKVQKLESPVAASDFTVKDLRGQKISLKEYRGKVVVLNFLSIWCPVCEKQASSFDKLDEEFKGKDVIFLHIAVERRREELLEYKKKFGISMPILIDEDGSVAKTYGIRGHHETFFINRKGKIVGKTFAEKDWTSPSMKNLIHHLLRED
jgi:peroxiredoxin